MELVKREDRYDLYADDGQKIGSTANNTLSQSNCLSIENGYNIEQLAEDYAKQSEGIDFAYLNGLYYGFLAGFKKAIELNKTTEWEVELEYELTGECTGNNNDGCFMDSSGHNCGCFRKQYKKDSNGCLILKRKL